jgi:hypothetical protein
MKRIKLYEEFVASRINEEATTPEDSKVTVDDFTTDSGIEIKSTEIVGAMVSSESEKDFKDYFYDTYGIDAFTETDMSTLTTYFNEYLEEVNAEEAEAEKEEEEAGDDPLADVEEPTEEPAEDTEDDLAAEIEELEKE